MRSISKFSEMSASVVLAACGFAISPAVAADSKGVALIELEHPLAEQGEALDWLFGSGERMTLRDLILKLEKVASDPARDVAVIRLKNVPLQTTQVEEVGEAIKKIRAAGKKVHIFSDGYETAELLLGSYADELILQQGGAVSLPGMHMEEMYLADTMAWAGIKPQMVQIGDYKGANEQFMRAEPTPQWSQCIDNLLDGLYGNVRTQLMTGRGLSGEQLDSAMKSAWLANGETAKTAKLIDKELDLPGLNDHLKTVHAAGDLDWKTITPGKKSSKLDMSNPFTLFSKLMREPDTSAKRDTIAVIHIDGPIVDGESSGGGFMGGSSVGAVTIRRAIEEIADDDLFKGAIIRVNSPGGSAIASEVMWQGVKRLSAKKPVWVSVGSMAASGGYYVAVSGSKIYVNPSSIVGSIGVVGGKLAMGGLFERAQIRTHERSRGPMGNMMSGTKPWDAAQVALVKTKMQETYDLFTSRVSAGRAGIDLSKTAEGRLFTGTQALSNGMADKLGGVMDAIRDLAGELSLAEGEYDVMDFPGPRSFADVMAESFGGASIAGAAGGAVNAQAGMERVGPAFIAGSIKQLVGPAAWPRVRDSLESFMQLREQPVLLTTPSVIIVK
jgi:protease IV